MQGVLKRVKMSIPDIVQLPLDIRVEILKRVDKLDTLIALVRQRPLMRTLKKNVIGKWFRYQCGISDAEEVDDIIQDLSSSFESSNEGLLELNWEHEVKHFFNAPSTGQIISLRTTGKTIWLHTNVQFVANLFQTNGFFIYRNDRANYIMFRDNSTTLEFVRLANTIDKCFSTFQRCKSSRTKLMMFDYRFPFDVFSFVLLPTLLEARKRCHESRYYTRLNFQFSNFVLTLEQAPFNNNLERKTFEYMKKALENGSVTVSELLKE